MKWRELQLWIERESVYEDLSRSNRTCSREGRRTSGFVWRLFAQKMGKDPSILDEANFQSGGSHCGLLDLLNVIEKETCVEMAQSHSNIHQGNNIPSCQGYLDWPFSLLDSLHFDEPYSIVFLSILTCYLLYFCMWTKMIRLRRRR